MLDFLAHLLDTSDFPSRWHCGSWTAEHGWLHILSDLGVWSAYVAIPCVLVYFLLRRKDLPFRSIFLLFGAFILACGTTHLMEAVIFWWPAYRLAGLIKLFTALVSWGTVFALVPVTPQALAMRSPEELAREIEERKRAEASLREAHASLQQSLREKEVLLKEIHHRVKNNLQVVSSLLQLQSQRSPDPAIVELFRESQHRVRSMALVHERLYRSQDFLHVDFTDYIASLAKYLFHSYKVDANRIRLDVEVRAVQLSIDAAIPCGLLVNELVANCLKHAFQGRDHGCVRIELVPATAGHIVLSVRDDGVGLPADLDLLNARSFGCQLVVDLAGQLHGTVQVERNGGTTVRVLFPCPQ